MHERLPRKAKFRPYLELSNDELEEIKKEWPDINIIDYWWKKENNTWIMFNKNPLGTEIP